MPLGNRIDEVLEQPVTTPVDHKFPWYVKFFFWNQKRKYGEILEPARLWGRTPRVFAGLAALYGALDRKSSPLEPSLRTLITVRVSQINWCSFCIDINSATALKRHVSEEKLADLASFEQSDLFTEKEKAALAYAEAVTFSDQNTTQSHFDRLRLQFDDDGIIELSALIAFQNLSSKFNASLAVAPPRLLQYSASDQIGEIMRGNTDKQMNVDQLYPRWLVAREKGAPVALIDVRRPEEYQAGHVPGAKLVPLDTLMAQVHEFPEQGDVFLICRSGARSAQAADYLARQCGRSNLINIDGGTMAWMQAGYPVDVG